MVKVNIKNLIYKQLNPIAMKLGLKMFIFDSESYYDYSDKLLSKLKKLGIPQYSFDELNSIMSRFKFVAVLNSIGKDVDFSSIVDAFKPFGMDDNDLNALSNEEGTSFFYWFSIDIEDLI